MSRSSSGSSAAVSHPASDHPLAVSSLAGAAAADAAWVSAFPGAESRSALLAACRLVLRLPPAVPIPSLAADFFSLGGDSLSAVQLVAMLNQQAHPNSEMLSGTRSHTEAHAQQTPQPAAARPACLPSLLTLADVYECPSLGSLLQRWTARMQAAGTSHDQQASAPSMESAASDSAPEAVTSVATSTSMHNNAAAAAAAQIMAELFGGAGSSPGRRPQSTAGEKQSGATSRDQRANSQDDTNRPATALSSLAVTPRQNAMADSVDVESCDLSHSQQRIWLAEQLHSDATRADAAAVGRSSRSRSGSIHSGAVSPTMTSRTRSSSPVGSAPAGTLRFTAYHISRLFVLTGALDMSALLLAVRSLIARHAQLRTGFTVDSVTQEARQYTMDAHDEASSVDAQISQLPRYAKDAKTMEQGDACASSPHHTSPASPRALSESDALRLWSASLDQRPFDLCVCPLVRVHLCPLVPSPTGAPRRALFLMFHHLTMDGWSLGIVLPELADMYRAIVDTKRKAKEGAANSRPPPPMDTADVVLAAKLPALPQWSYLDYACWHRKLCDPSRRDPLISAQLRFWCAELKGFEPLQLPLDFAHTNIPSATSATRFGGDVVQLQLPTEMLSAMHTLCRRLRVSLFSVLLSSVQLVLSKVTSQSDVLVGTATAGRHYPGASEVVGCFINMMACRAKFDTPHAASGEQMIKDTHATMIRSLENQDVPFEQVCEAVHAQEQQQLQQQMADVNGAESPVLSFSPAPVDFSVGRTAPDPSPLFDVVVVLQNQSSRRGRHLDFGLDLACELVDHPVQTSKLKLAIIAEEEGSKEAERVLNLRFEFHTGSLLRASVAALARHWQCLVEQLVCGSSSPLSSYSLLSAADRTLLVRDFNARHARPEWLESDTLIHLLIEQQCKRTPHLPAVQVGDESITYKQLDEQSSQACNLMRSVAQQHAELTRPDMVPRPNASSALPWVISSAGPLSPPRCPIVPDDVIAICLPPSLELFVLIVGVMKLGAAYVPLDPAYPQDRLRFMLRDSGAKMIITTRELLVTLTAQGGSSADAGAGPNVSGDLGMPVLLLDDCWPTLLLQSCEYVPSSVCRTNLAYVIYTSGSTGQPKGVCVEHWTMCNMSRYFFLDLTVGKRVLQFASQSFDAAVAEWSCCFVVGACLCLTRGNHDKVGQGLVDTLARYAIHIAMVSPSVLASITPCALPSLDYLVVAGEANTEQVLDQWRPFVKLRNAYGPTEITVCSNTFTYDGQHPASCIGFPQPNYRCYVLDAARQLVPIGVAGELYIGGVGVARGYLNRPELTAERFLADPFAPADCPYTRMYRSGDIVRWLPDGTLLYHGRNDAQVKIRGVRVELGEIEHTLCKHPRISRAVVLAKDMPSGKQLVAFVVVKGGRGASISTGSDPAEVEGARSSSANSSLDAADVDAASAAASSLPTRPVLAHSFALRSIHKHMQLTVPAHMRPTYYVFLPTLPINRSAKTDLQALAAVRVGPEHMASRRRDRHVSLDTTTPTAAGAGNRHPPPFSLRSPGQQQPRLSPTPPLALTPSSSSSHRRRTADYIHQLGAIRTQLVAAWCRVLNRAEVDGSENFFEAGGHSILAAQLHSSLPAEIRQHVRLLHLFMYPTINSLCAFLMQARSNARAADQDGSVTPLAAVNSPGPTRKTSRADSITPLTSLQILLNPATGHDQALADAASQGESFESMQLSSALPTGSARMQHHHSLASTRVSSALSFDSEHDSAIVDSAASAPAEIIPVDPADDPIAIIGMAGRFPGANSVPELWHNLCSGTESIHFYSREELAAAGVPDEQLARSEYVRAMGVLDDVFGFDAAFFRMSAREAEIMDPQHRVFLETAWTALEDAGYAANPGTHQQPHSPDADEDPVLLHADSVPRVGVFAGCGVNTYLSDYCMLELSHLSPADRHSLLTANEKDFLASRVSYKLNLNGPALVVQTACSTSLVAIHTACVSLRRGECDLALAGGVSLGQLKPVGYLYEPGMILSPDGHCRAFDADACGTVRGQGAGAVVLKRLSQARADGDLIYAVVKGSAINNDGSHKVSYSAPSASGQAAVIRAALESANVHPRSIGFVEAHGTGTHLGDLIEVAALTKAYRAYTADTGFATLGSVKTNIGHLDAAAGVTGFIKAVLTLHHALIPGTMHFRKPSPQLQLDTSPFLVRASNVPFPHDVTNSQCRGSMSASALPSHAGGPHAAMGFPIPDPEGCVEAETPTTPMEQGQQESNLCPPRAAVSSFGIGGTNAHAILETAPPHEGTDGTSGMLEALVPVVLCWSALNSSACCAFAQSLSEWLRIHPTVPLRSVAYTLQLHRAHFDVRQTIVASSVAEAIEKLEAVAVGPAAMEPHAFDRPASNPVPPSLVFLFPGQGSHFGGMGLDLYASEPAFSALVDECLVVLRTVLPSQFGEITAQQLFAGEKLDQTQFAQPALFILEYSLAQLLRRWGLQPAAMLGHSLGQYVAACVAGVFSLADCLRLVVARSQLMHELIPAGIGCMLSVRIGEEELARRFPRTAWSDVTVAASNSHMHCTLSGPVQPMMRLQAAMTAEGVVCTRLPTSHAFHSPMLAPMVHTYEQALQHVSMRPPDIPLICNVTGGWSSHDSMQTPSYWIDHMMNKVCFRQGLEALLQAATPRQDGDSSAVDAAQPQLHQPLFIEVGPGNSCLALLKQQAACLAAQAGITCSAAPDTVKPAPLPLDRCIALLPKPRSSHDAPAPASSLETALLLAAHVWSRGLRVDWSQLYSSRPVRVRLPTYPFQRVRHVMSGSPLSPSRILSLPSSQVRRWSRTREGPAGREDACLPTTLADPQAVGVELQVQRLCVHLFHALLGVPLSALSAASDFFSLGGDSLMAIQLLAELRKQFRIPLPGSLLMSFPTPAGLAQQVAAIMHSAQEDEGSMKPETQTTGEAQPANEHDGGDNYSANSGPFPAALALGQPCSQNSSCADPSALMTSPRSACSFSSAQGSSRGSALARLLRSSLTVIQSGLDADVGSPSARAPSLPPLFLVHPIGGELYYYRDLAPLLGPRQSVYGFRAVSLDGETPPCEEIRDMAARYVEELIQFLTQNVIEAAAQQSHSPPSAAASCFSPTVSASVPSGSSSCSSLLSPGVLLSPSPSPTSSPATVGPILLGGVSFGGTVAYEMSLLLSGRGYSVPLLVLVDSPAPGALPQRLGDENGVREYIAAAHSGPMADSIRAATITGDAVFTGAPSLLSPSVVGTWLAHERALFSYQPSLTNAPFSGRALFFRPSIAMKHTPLNMVRQAHWTATPRRVLVPCALCFAADVRSLCVFLGCV